MRYTILTATLAIIFCIPSSDCLAESPSKQKKHAALLEKLLERESQVEDELEDLTASLDRIRASTKDSASLLGEAERSAMMAQLVQKVMVLEAEAIAAASMASIAQEERVAEANRIFNKAKIEKNEIKQDLLRKQITMIRKQVTEHRSGKYPKNFNMQSYTTENASTAEGNFGDPFSGNFDNPFGEKLPKDAKNTKQYDSKNPPPEELRLNIATQLENQIERMEAQLETLRIEQAALTAQMKQKEVQSQSAKQIRRLSKETELKAFKDQLKRLKETSSDSMKIQLLRRKIERQQELLNAISMKLFNVEMELLELESGID